MVHLHPQNLIPNPELPQEEALEGGGGNPDWSVVSRTAVLADAEGLLTCYGVGEESSAQLTHAVIELCFTSSVRFLQPGLLLQVRLVLSRAQGLGFLGLSRDSGRCRIDAR
jgi:hypothetical protein